MVDYIDFEFSILYLENKLTKLNILSRVYSINLHNEQEQLQQRIFNIQNDKDDSDGDNECIKIGSSFSLTSCLTASKERA